jgi:hypothetical protein
MRRILAVALFVVLLAICYMPSAQAFTFSDDFSSGINSYWWTAYTNGTKNIIDATGGNIKMVQMENGTLSTGLSFNFSVTGDFTAKVDYTLNTGKILNGERVGLASGLGAVERLEWNASADWQLYLTHFGDSLQGHTTTTDTTGKLQLSRSGNILSGSYWDGNGWVLLHSYDNVANAVDTTLGFSIWPDNYTGVANFGTTVTFDNFSLNAPTMVDPTGGSTGVPEPATMLLVGLGLIGVAGMRRRLTK